LDFFGKLLVLGLVVAFERDLVDDRVFDHRHDQASARLADPDVLEQIGGVERLEPAIDALRRQWAVKVRSDRIGFDPPVALDHDLGGRLRIGNSLRAEGPGGQPEQQTCEDQAPKAQSSKHPTHHSHPRYALASCGCPVNAQQAPKPESARTPSSSKILQDLQCLTDWINCETPDANPHWRRI